MKRPRAFDRWRSVFLETLKNLARSRPHDLVVVLVDEAAVAADRAIARRRAR